MSEKVLVETTLGDEPITVGTAYFHVARSEISTTFSYDAEYLASRRAYAIDPELPLSTAPFSVAGLPGAFEDCSPDRWGRNLVAKQHQRLIADGAASHRRLTAVDYLLGVSDTTRQGALRFRWPSDDEYLGSGTHIPRLLSLPELQRAADEAAEGSETAIKRLLDAGTGSLGGARPKASVLADDGRLMMAKFSRATDPWSVIAWEKLALDLATACGISVPTSRLLRIDSRPVLVLERFDRLARQRLGYMSAMTATQRKDGEAGDYLDIVEAIEDMSSNWRAGCADLYRRTVLSVAIHNTDDHLRNHGFLRTATGWDLSPAFDVNPDPDLDDERQTAILGVTNADDEAETLLEFGSMCHLTPDGSRQIIDEVVSVVGDWQSAATSIGIPAAEQKEFAAGIDTQLDRLRAAARTPL